MTFGQSTQGSLKSLGLEYEIGHTRPMMGQYANKVRKGNVTSIISCGKSFQILQMTVLGASLSPNKSMTLEHYHSSLLPVATPKH